MKEELNQTLARDQLSPGRDCPLCHAEKPIYQFNNTCCRARFLVNQPDRETRNGWMDRWMRELDTDTLNEIRTLTIKLWEDKTAT